MEALHLPDNIKVHFAGCEVQNQYLAVEALGVRYGLYTCFPYVERVVFGKGVSPVLPLRWMQNPAVDIPRNICKGMGHVIQDSGLFTLMFGARKGKKDEALIAKWYDSLVQFTLDHCAARLQVQERLVSNVVDMIAAALGTEHPPLGIALVMKGEHLCKTMRGAKKQGLMTTSKLTGIFEENSTARAEFMSLIK